MAVGLVVDYMVHIVHCFLHQVRGVVRNGEHTCIGHRLSSDLAKLYLRLLLLF